MTMSNLSRNRTSRYWAYKEKGQRRRHRRVHITVELMNLGDVIKKIIHFRFSQGHNTSVCSGSRTVLWRISCFEPCNHRPKWTWAWTKFIMWRSMHRREFLTSQLKLPLNYSVVNSYNAVGLESTAVSKPFIVSRLCRWNNIFITYSNDPDHVGQPT